MRTKNLREPPAPFGRAGERAAAALLRAEGAALPLLRAPVRAATTRLLARLALLRLDDRRRAAEEAVRAVRVEADALARDAAGAVTTARLGSKRLSLVRLAKEWEIVRRLLAKGGHAPPGPLPTAAEITPTDLASADAGARGIAAAWSLSATTSIWDWQGGRAAVPGPALDRAAARLDHRTRRLAATETARAFADARDEGMGWMITEHRDRVWAALLVKRWEAANDRKVCAVCRELDGAVVPLGVPFPHGAEPGYVHPHCRCVPALVLLPAPLSRSTRSGRHVPEAA